MANPPAPRVGRSLRQAVKAAPNTAVVVGGVAVDGGVLPALGPKPPRRPKPALASLAGTPWASMQLVYRARAAAKPAGVEADGEETDAGAAVVVDAEPVLVPPPLHAPATMATAATAGNMTKREARQRGRGGAGGVVIGRLANRSPLRATSDLTECFLRLMPQIPRKRA